MRLFLLLLAFFSSHFVYSQIESIVANIDSKKAIPYASIYIKNSKTGTSSDLEGKFSIAIDSVDTLMISSVGFKSLEIPFGEIKDTIKMEYDIRQMSEIIVRPTREKGGWFAKRNVLGDIKNSFFSVNIWMNSGGNAFQIARFFEYRAQYRTTPYIHKVTFNTWGKIDNAIYAVKFYEANKEGLPGKLINSETIIGNAKKRGHKSVLNLKDLNIRFPKGGLFVAIDFINIEQNRYLKEDDYGFLYDDYKYRYAPSIGLKHSEDFELYQFDYQKGKWYLSQDFRAIIECEILLIE